MTISTDDTITRLDEHPRAEGPGRELVAELFRVLADPLVGALLRLRVPPPAVVLVHAAIGFAAAAAIGTGALLAGALLLQLKTLLDNADGQLARASGQVTALGRYLDTEADLLVNASLFAALAVVADAPWLALAAFCGLTLVLSVDHNVAVLYGEARGRITDAPRASASSFERALVLAYRAVFAPQDRLVRAVSARRLARVLVAEPDPLRLERATRAYHDRVTATILANLGLSTQLLLLGVCLALGAPVAYLWLVLASLSLLPALQLRREWLVRRSLSG
jgi:archaetidylinositol phosphate synthase